MLIINGCIIIIIQQVRRVPTEYDPIRRARAHRAGRNTTPLSSAWGTFKRALPLGAFTLVTLSERTGFLPIFAARHISQRITSSTCTARSRRCSLRARIGRRTSSRISCTTQRRSSPCTRPWAQGLAKILQSFLAPRLKFVFSFSMEKEKFRAL